MAQVLVVADDLTGANATGARFADAGLRAATVTPGHVTAAVGTYDVVVTNTDSRHLPVERAAALVRDVVEAVGPVRLVVKRADTTLRGNVGAELEAAWRVVRDRTPPPTPVRVLLVPAHPESHRVTVDGIQLLDGVPLEHTELAHDPDSPMRTSVVADIVAAQSRLAVRHVPIRHITSPNLAELIVAGDEPVVLCDALTGAHLHAIADAAAEAHRRTGTVWVAVDPGPAGALLATALGVRGDDSAAGPLLAVSASATDLTRRQLTRLTDSATTVRVDVSVTDLCRGGADRRRAVAAEIGAALRGRAFPDTVLVSTVSGENRSELSAAERRALPAALAEAVATAVTESRRPSGLYTTGGAATAAVLEALGARLLDVRGEVVPLAVHGVLVGGALDGVPIVTKGGLVGNDDTAVTCLRELRRLARARHRGVRAEIDAGVEPRSRADPAEPVPAPSNIDTRRSL